MEDNAVYAGASSEGVSAASAETGLQDASVSEVVGDGAAIDSNGSENLSSGSGSENGEQTVAGTENGTGDDGKTGETGEGENDNVEASESDSVFTEEQLTDAIKALLLSKTEGENAELSGDETAVSGSGDSGSGSGDYGAVLDQILTELQTANDSDLPLTAENIYTEIGDQIRADSLDTPLDDLSVTNVLLCGVFLLLLVNLAVKFGKGVLS